MVSIRKVFVDEILVSYGTKIKGKLVYRKEGAGENLGLARERRDISYWKLDVLYALECRRTKACFVPFPSRRAWTFLYSV